MDGACLQRDPAFGGPRTDGEQRGAVESQSLFHGLGCGAIADVGLVFDSGAFGAGFDEHNSLFGGDADIESLFGGLDDEEGPQQQQHQALASPLPFPLTLPLPALPLPLPALPPTGSSESSCDVSTLLPEHQNQHQQAKEAKEAIGLGQNGAEEDGLLLSDLGLDCGLDVDFDFDFDVDIGLAVELEMARQTQETEQEKAEKAEKAGEAQTKVEASIPSGHQESLITTATNTLSPTSNGADGGRASLQHPRPGIDTPFHAAGLGTHDDQEGQGPNIANSDDDDDDDDDDSDVVILSSRQVQGFVPPPVLTSIPHYLELRPRCPQGPPPARIDLDNYNVEELLPYVQLHSKLSIRGIQDLLGLDVDTGRYIIATCHDHLANPAHTVYMSGSSDPAALRILKVTLILSSLALLKDGDGRAGMGPCWFGRDSPLEPKSMHAWPDDSTTLTLLFIQLLYRLTRNKSARERHRKLNTASPDSTPGKERSPKLSKSPEPPKSTNEYELKTPEPSNEPTPRKRKRKAPQPRAVPKPSTPPIPAPPRPLTNLAYNSPRVLRDALLSSNVNRNMAPVSEPEKASHPALKAPSPAAVAADLCPAKRPPADANIRYRVNIVDGRSQQRAVPQIVLGHEGAIRSAGYSYVTDLCAQLDQTVDTISMVTLLGLEQISSDVGWDRVVGRVHDEMLMDGEVRILVCLRN